MVDVVMDLIRPTIVIVITLYFYYTIGFEITLLTILIVGILVITSQLHDILKMLERRGD